HPALALNLALEAVRMTPIPTLPAVDELFAMVINNHERAVLRGHDKAVNTTWAPSGNGEGRLLSASDDGTGRIWHADGSVSAVLRGHTGAVLFGAWSK